MKFCPITLTTKQAAEIMRGPIKYVAKMEQPPKLVSERETWVLCGTHSSKYVTWELRYMRYEPVMPIDRFQRPLPYPKGATVEVRKVGFRSPSVNTSDPLCTATVTDVRVCQYQDIPRHYPELPRNYQGCGSQEWDDNEYIEVVTIRKGE